MVRYRKPPKPSGDIIDLRVKRSPRGTIPSSAAALLQRKKEYLAQELEEEFRLQRAAELRAAVLRRQRGR